MNSEDQTERPEIRSVSVRFARNVRYESFLAGVVANFALLRRGWGCVAEEARPRPGAVGFDCECPLEGGCVEVKVAVFVEEVDGGG